MYLKSLELHGFKSFPNKTVLTFERGTTIVVGPNGSGKSNISDAMRWVLGELSSKNIRGKRMEDVIFGGTDLRRPMSYAEVSVTFDNSTPDHRINSPYDEITVTRRYYRSGESEYMINRKNCRLRDIRDLFMNTGIGKDGYSIIGQGKIAEILSAKSEDRRNIFEEAAGISRYRKDKEETEKRLAGVEQNVESVSLIFQELDARVGPLARDAEKAKKYRELLEIKKGADVSLWLFDTQRIKADLEKATDVFRLASAEYERLKESIESLEQQSDRVHDKLTGRRIASEQLLSQINETTKQINSLESGYQLASGNIRSLMEMSMQSRERIEKIKEEDALVLARQAETATRIDTLQKEEKEALDAQLELLSEMDGYSRAAMALENALGEKLARLEDINQKIMDLRVRIDVAQKAKDDGKDKGSELSLEIEKYLEAEKALSQEVERCERNTLSYKIKIDAAEAVIAKGTDDLRSLEGAREEEGKLLNDASAEKSGILQRAESLRRMDEHFEGYQHSVRFVMQEYAKNSSRFRGEIYGPISKLISTENKYITAIETALGQNLQYIAVEDEETAKSAIAVLKNANAGRATFYPLSAIRETTETDEIRRAASFAGYINRADKIISFDPKYRSVMEYLLLRTLVFDNIDHATEAAKQLRYRVRIVTLDGQLINAGGSFTGGSVKRDSGILSRSGEIDELEKRARELDVKIASAKKKLSEIEEKIETTKRKMQDAEQSRDLLYTMSRAQFSELDNANAKLDANRALLSKLEADRERLFEDGGRFEADIASLGTELDALASQANMLREERGKDDIERQRLLDLREAKSAEIADAKLRIAMIGKDIENARASKEADMTTVALHQKDKEELSLRIEGYNEQIAALEREKEENRAKISALEASLSKFENDRTETEQDSDALDKRDKELREMIRQANDDRERCFAEYTRSDAKLSRLREENERLETKLYDEYQITYEEATALNYPAVTAQNRAEVAAVLSSCKSKIRELGSVNPNAVEEYEEVKSRHEELKVQLDDLTKSRLDLLEIVTRIEQEMRASFQQTFDQINENFGIVFGELFGGGQAELSLSDPEDVLTCGIEIKAAPPGKIIKNLSLLSGGEQTFVAIALIFAILKANPTPFCIFDEIEAALDEVNVDRFGAYVQKYSEKTQFVLITHRRGTMEIGDRLYGITMPERGISRAVPLDVSEIESKQKELLS